MPEIVQSDVRQLGGLSEGECQRRRMLDGAGIVPRFTLTLPPACSAALYAPTPRVRAPSADARCPMDCRGHVRLPTTPKSAVAPQQGMASTALLRFARARGYPRSAAGMTLLVA
jgi:hypothetical protein